jgi:hypothetical protein
MASSMWLGLVARVLLRFTRLERPPDWPAYARTSQELVAVAPVRVEPEEETFERESHIAFWAFTNSR